MRGGRKGIFEDFQFGSWSKVPRLCLFSCLLLPNWLLPLLNVSSHWIWAVKAVGWWVIGSRLPWAALSGCGGNPVSPARDAVSSGPGWPPPLGGSLVNRPQRSPWRPSHQAPGADWVWEWALGWESPEEQELLETV